MCGARWFPPWYSCHFYFNMIFHSKPLKRGFWPVYCWPALSRTWRGYIIPDRFLAAGIVLFIGDFFLTGPTLSRALDAALGGFGVAGAVLALVLWMEKRMGREAMGGGDLKMLCLTGLFFGWKGNLFCLILACVFGIVCGLAVQRRHGQSAPIPWGPSIAAAAWGTALFAQPLIEWYLSLFWYGRKLP